MNESKGKVNAKLKSHSLTFSSFSFTSCPQVEQRRALFKKGVWILNTNPVDVVDTELQLTRQFWSVNKKTSLMIFEKCVFRPKPLQFEMCHTYSEGPREKERFLCITIMYTDRKTAHD